MKYAKGPWRVFEAGDFWGINAFEHSPYQSIIIFGEEGEDSGVHGKDNEEMEANARLIAAAPDYDSMARNLEKWWRLPNSERTIEAIEPIVRQALDAIAKAEGTND